MNMLQPLLTRLDELEKSATKGEWEFVEDYLIRKRGTKKTSFVLKHPMGARVFSDDQVVMNDEEVKSGDARFITELRNAYPLLRAEIERLQEVERKYKELVK